MRLVRILVATLAIFCFAAIEIQADGLSGTSIYKKCLPSVMVLTVKNKSGGEDLGTAFLALKDGLAVTAWHVVRDAKSVTATFSDGSQYQVSGLVDKDEQRDIALIRVKVTGRRRLPLAPDRPEVGSKAYVIGAPEGLAFTISDGLISQTWHSKGASFYQYTCPSSPGNSGGPVLNGSGQVIGIVDWQTTEGQNLNFAVPVAYVRDLDSTMATTPWSALKSTGSSPDVTNANNSDLDKELGQAFLDLDDGRRIFMYVQGLMSHPETMPGGVPSDLYETLDAINEDLSALSNVVSDNASRERVRVSTVFDLQHLSEALQLMAQSVRGLNDSQATVEDDVDLMSRAIAASQETKEPSIEDLNVLVASKDFINAAPEMVAEHNDHALAWLGFLPLHRRTYFVCVVFPGSVADQLGIKPGDTLMSVDGQDADNCHLFSKLVQGDIGKTTDIVVLRDGKNVEIKGDVPSAAINTASSISPPASGGDDDLSTKLASLVMDALDVRVLISYSAGTRTKHVPPIMEQMRIALEGDEEAVGAVHASDPDLEQVRVKLLTIADDYAKAETNLARALVALSSNGNGDPMAGALLARGAEEIGDAPTITPYDQKILLSSKAFVAAAPELAKIWQITDSYRLGANILMHNSLFIGVVVPDSVADQIGLHAGDQVVSIDGKTPSDIVDFRDAVQKDTGSTADIVVTRDGKQVELKNKVPPASSL